MFDAAFLRRTFYVVFGMPLKFGPTANRAEVITLAVNNERLSNLFASKLHFADRIDHCLFSIVHSCALRGVDSPGWIIGQLNTRCWQMEHLCSHFPSRANVVRAPWHPEQMCLVIVALGYRGFTL